MIAEFGQMALIIALLLSLLQAAAPLWAKWRTHSFYFKFNQNIAVAQCGFVLLSFIFLWIVLISNDFSVVYVAQNSNAALPLFYRISALWGAHEGSMLLWVSVLSLWTLGVVFFTKTLTLRDRSLVLAVLGVLSFGFLLFILITSNPFLRILPNPPIAGEDLNPLLQDPGLAVHPPMLYMGYVGFAATFAFAAAALIQGKFPKYYVKALRPFALIAWCFLTLGITLGSLWSYRVLGWGGFWFWDPVENASFLPWLSGTALVHCLVVTEKRGTLKNWTLFLAICTFSLSLIGTFLVRSGILVSVHAFAADPDRGRFMLFFLVLVISSSLTLYAIRARTFQNTMVFHWFAKESFILLNNLFLFAAMLTLLLGTLYPLMIDALGLGKISVGAPYFNRVFVPLIAPLLFFMGIVPFTRWRSKLWKLSYQKFLVIFCLAFAFSLLLPWLWQHHVTLLSGFSCTLAFWIILNTLYAVKQHLHTPKKNIGMSIAHIGVALCVLGIAFTTLFGSEENISMKPQDKFQVAGYEFIFKAAKPISGPNYQGIAAFFEVFQNNKKVAVLAPQRRIFQRDHLSISKVAIKVGWFRDIYIALGGPMPDRAQAVRIYYKPLVRFIWGGGLFMLSGGIIALIERKKYAY